MKKVYLFLLTAISLASFGFISNTRVAPSETTTKTQIDLQSSEKNPSSQHSNHHLIKNSKYSHSSLVINQLPELFNESFADGILAFKQSMKRVDSFLNQIEGVSTDVRNLFQNSDYSTVVTIAISDIYDPQSHLYLELINLRCRHINLNYSRAAGQEISLYTERLESKVITEKDYHYYEGVLEGKRQYQEKMSYECQAASDLVNGLDSIIAQYFSDVYGAATFGEYWLQFSEEEAFENFSTLTGITKNNALLLKDEHAKILKLKDDKKIIQSFRKFASLALHDPKLYIDSVNCFKHNNCQQHLGKVLYRNFISGGAFLGEHGTFGQLMELLSQEKRTLERLAWLKYKRKLTRIGCQSSHIINKDINIAILLQQLKANYNQYKFAPQIKSLFRLSIAI